MKEYFYKLDRILTLPYRTFGVLMPDENQSSRVNPFQPLAYTLEDTYHTHKIYGKTRIPEGIYQLRLRKAGRLHRKYSERYDFHKGMIELIDVPNFKYIYFHIGNTEKDTSGCILVGNAIGRRQLLYSTIAYKRFYKHYLMMSSIYDKVHVIIKDIN